MPSQTAQEGSGAAQNEKEVPKPGALKGNDEEELSVDSAEDEESDDENEEEYVEVNQRQIMKMLKPVYLPKEKRENTSSVVEEENELIEQEKKKQQERIKEETKNLLIQAVKAGE